MSLKTDYGLAAALDTAFNAGKDYIGTELAPGSAYPTLSAGLTDAASQGKETFLISVAVLHAPETLKLQNKYWLAFQSGMYQALADEGIYNTEVTFTLNVADTLETKIDFNFSF